MLSIEGLRDRGIEGLKRHGQLLRVAPDSFRSERRAVDSEAGKTASNSFASVSNGFIFEARTISHSTSNSSQNAVSSASSTTTFIFDTNSFFDRARQTAR